MRGDLAPVRGAGNMIPSEEEEKKIIMEEKKMVVAIIAETEIGNFMI